MPAIYNKKCTHVSFHRHTGTDSFVLSGTSAKFSITFDLSWKVMKDILVQYYAITGFVAGSPREVLRESFKAALISDDAWMDMLKIRNEFAHDYDSEIVKTHCNTIVMSLMNGVDSEEIISARIGASHVIHSLIKVASHKEGDGFYFNPETTMGIIFGEISAPYQSERVQAIEELFKGTGLHYRITEHIREEIWSKFRLNVSNNLPQAVLGAGVGCYQDSTHMKHISNGLRQELEAIAAAKGIDMSKADVSSNHGSPVAPSTRYSTLQDIDAGRHTEIDMFSGALVRMGKELGIPTPYNEYTYHIIKAIEEKNDGKFDYSKDGGKATYAK